MAAEEAESVASDRLLSMLMLVRPSEMRRVCEKLLGEDIEKRGSTDKERRRLADMALKFLLSRVDVPPIREEPRDLSYFKRRRRDPVRYSLGKNTDEIRDKLVERVERVAARASVFVVGKTSGGDWRTAVASRIRARYSRCARYSRILIIYEDVDTNARFHKSRERRCLRLERRLHRHFEGHCKWDSSISDLPGKQSKDPNAKMFLYVAYGKE